MAVGITVTIILYLEAVRHPFAGDGLLTHTRNHLGDVDEGTLERKANWRKVIQFQKAVIYL